MISYILQTDYNFISFLVENKFCIWKKIFKKWEIQVLISLFIRIDFEFMKIEIYLPGHHQLKVEPLHHHGVVVKNE